MSDEELLVAERVVPVEQSGALTVRILQHPAEDFWRVDVTGAAAPEARASAIVSSDGGGYILDLIHDAVGGEPVAWRHLAHWGGDRLTRPDRAMGPRLA